MLYRTDKSRRENVRCTNPFPTPPTKHMSMEHTTRVNSWIKLNNSATVKRLLFGKPNDIPVPYANTILYPCSLCILGSLWDTHCIKKDNFFKPFHPQTKKTKRFTRQTLYHHVIRSATIRLNLLPLQKKRTKQTQEADITCNASR